MDSTLRNLAVIPARGGSKRVPGKNIREFCGKPIIAYAIEAAVASELFQQVVVSTDSEEIARVSQQCGAETPFLRTGQLADDHAPVSEVTIDVLQRLDPEGVRFTGVCQLMANCPLRTDDDVRLSYSQFSDSGADAQISTSQFGFLNPWWAMEQDPQRRLSPIFTKYLNSRSQDLPQLFCPNGAIWWAKPEALRRAGTFHMEGRTGFELPWQHAVDIDTNEDWALAELLMRARSGAESAP